MNVQPEGKKGRPYKRKQGDLVTPPLPIIAALPAMQPLPPLDCSNDNDTGEKRNSRRVVGWSIAGIGGAIGVGIFHGIGARILDVVWPYIERFLPFAL